MTALPLEPHTEAEEATLARIEGAEPAEESTLEKVARALCDGDAEDHDTYTWDEANDELRDEYRRAACHAIGAMKGSSRAEEALRRVEAVCAKWETTARRRRKLAETYMERGRWQLADAFRSLARNADVHAARIRTAIAAPAAQAGEGR